jgi:hypothetical protein
VKKYFVATILILIVALVFLDYSPLNDSQGESDNIRIDADSKVKLIDEKDAFNKLHKVLNLDNDFSFTGLDEEGGYTYSNESTTSTGRTYVINPYNGNVYYGTSGATLQNVLINAPQIYNDEEILNLAKKSMLVQIPKDSFLETYGYYFGDLILIVWNKSESAKAKEIMRYRVDPISTEVYDFDKKYVYGNLLGL